MATKMLMPLLGQTMEEGTIIRWFKNEGDRIEEGEPLLEVLTDKANMEVEAPASGVLRKIIAKPDDIVPVKAPIAIIGTADEPIDDLLAETPSEGETEVKAEVQEGQALRIEVVPSAESSAPAPPVSEGRVIASPAARRVAREKGIDISLLAGRGSGPGGRIVERDVLAYAASTAATPLAARIAEDLGVKLGDLEGTGIGGKITSSDVFKATSAPATAVPAIGQVIPFAGVRKAVARNVASSAQSAVHVTLVTEVDMTECVALRSSVLQAVEAKYGVRISYTDIIVKAAAKAIEEKPIVNSSLAEDKIIIHDHINIGLATAIENGLVVPVIKDANLKTIPQISMEAKELAARAREGKSTAEDLSGGTFSITNLGAYGVDSFNPVITPGQSAILGVCAIRERPVVIGGQVVVRSMMNLCLSFDHRVMDGAPAAEYLAAVRQILEAPYLMFL